MAPSLRACLALSIALCASSEVVPDDGVVLHQQLLLTRSIPKESHHVAPGFEEPSKSMISKMRPLIRESANGIVKRATTQMKLPIPSLFFMDLVGKITKWAMNRYEKPKKTAVLELVNEAVEYYASILSSKDFPALNDTELVARLSDVNKVQEMGRHYIDKAGAPPAVSKLFDAVAEATRSKGTLDAQSTAQLVLDVANQTSGPALAEYLAYLQAVGAGKVQLDQAHLLDLQVPVLTKFGAPSAVADFVRQSADMTRQHVVAEPNQEGARLALMLAKSNDELGMPQALTETYEFIAGILANASNSHIFEKPEEHHPVLAHLNDLVVKVNDQLGGLQAASQLIALHGRPVKGGAPATPEETLSLLVSGSREVGIPGSVTEFLEYLGPIVAQKQAVDSEKALDLMQKMIEELGMPGAASKVLRDARTQALKKGGTLDEAKMVKIVTQLLSKLGMSAFANIYSHMAIPLMKGKQPDALAVAAMMPSLMKVLPDLETADHLAQDMKEKVVGPFVAVFDRMAEKLTGNMPETGAKTVVKGALHLLRPKVEAEA